LSPAKKGTGEEKIVAPAETPSAGTIECSERLGELIKHYYRKAAQAAAAVLPRSSIQVPPQLGRHRENRNP
jgi:hypothetical protein